MREKKKKRKKKQKSEDERFNEPQVARDAQGRLHLGKCLLKGALIQDVPGRGCEKPTAETD